LKKPTDNTYSQAQKTAAKIFRYKKIFHLAQSCLPIEEKIRQVVELQKIVFKIKKGDTYLRDKTIWKI